MIAQPSTTGVFAGYEDPTSHFSRRLAVVQQCVREALDAMPPGPIVVVDICGGVGNALLPVLPSHPRRQDVRAFLLELDAASARFAREMVREHALPGVQVVEADAGLSQSYVGLDRARLVILSGVLAHLSGADRARTLGFLRQICAPEATLIWTIGIRRDPSRIPRTRRCVVDAGFEPLALHRVERRITGGGLKHEVGVARMTRRPEPLEPGVRLFTFKPTLAQRFPWARRTFRPFLPLVRVFLTRR